MLLTRCTSVLLRMVMIRIADMLLPGHVGTADSGGR